MTVVQLAGELDSNTYYQFQSQTLQEIEASVDAVWHGCDVVPQTRIQNMATMLKD